MQQYKKDMFPVFNTFRCLRGSQFLEHSLSIQKCDFIYYFVKKYLEQLLDWSRLNCSSTLCGLQKGCLVHRPSTENVALDPHTYFTLTPNAMSNSEDKLISCYAMMADDNNDNSLATMDELFDEFDKYNIKLRYVHYLVPVNVLHNQQTYSPAAGTLDQ